MDVPGSQPKTEDRLRVHVRLRIRMDGAAPRAVVRHGVPRGPRHEEASADFSQLDLDFSRTFRIRGTELRLMASVLNVFDREAVTAVNPLEESAGEPIDYQRPRRFEVGLRYAF